MVEEQKDQKRNREKIKISPFLRRAFRTAVSTVNVVGNGFRSLFKFNKKTRNYKLNRFEFDETNDVNEASNNENVVLYEKKVNRHSVVEDNGENVELPKLPEKKKNQHSIVKDNIYENINDTDDLGIYHNFFLKKYKPERVQSLDEVLLESDYLNTGGASEYVDSVNTINKDSMDKRYVNVTETSGALLSKSKPTESVYFDMRSRDGVNSPRNVVDSTLKSKPTESVYFDMRSGDGVNSLRNVVDFTLDSEPKPTESVYNDINLRDDFLENATDTTVTKQANLQDLAVKSVKSKNFPNTRIVADRVSEYRVNADGFVPRLPRRPAKEWKR